MENAQKYTIKFNFNIMNKEKVDKIGMIIRIIIGIVIFGIGWSYKSFWGLLGFIPIIIALSGKCPLSSILGKKVCSMQKDKK